MGKIDKVVAVVLDSVSAEDFKDKKYKDSFPTLKGAFDMVSSPLTTYVMKFTICQVTPISMVKCSKSYCKSCSFQSLQKATSCAKSVRTEHSYNMKASFRFFSPYIVMHLVKVFAIATGYQEPVS